MRGGTRSNRRIFPDSVHEFMAVMADRNTIFNALQDMSADERTKMYLELNKPPRPSTVDDLEEVAAFNDVFAKHYPDEFEFAYKNMGELNDFYKLEAIMSKPSNPKSYYAPKGYAPKGGKTCRNRRRRNRRRSLKRKHSRRR